MNTTPINPQSTPRTDSLRIQVSEGNFLKRVEKVLKSHENLELELNQANETINIQHGLIKSGEQRGMAKVQEELNKAKAEIERLKTSWNSQQALLKCCDAKIAELHQRLDATQAKVEVVELKEKNAKLHSIAEELVEALQRLWNDDEMGWLIGNGRVECVQCGASIEQPTDGPTADLSTISHNDGCVQGYIYAALTHAKEGGVL